MDIGMTTHGAPGAGGMDTGHFGAPRVGTPVGSGRPAEA